MGLNPCKFECTFSMSSLPLWWCRAMAQGSFQPSVIAAPASSPQHSWHRLLLVHHTSQAMPAGPASFELPLLFLQHYRCSQVVGLPGCVVSLWAPLWQVCCFLVWGCHLAVNRALEDPFQSTLSPPGHVVPASKPHCPVPSQWHSAVGKEQELGCCAGGL